MPLIPYTKLHATPAQRVAHLRARGLIIPNSDVAEREIELIGYERLRIYFLSRRQLNVSGRPFIAGTTYHQIIKIYECDAKLREACFHAVGQFEVLLRNAMSEALSLEHTSHPYFDHSAFLDPKAHLDALQSFNTVYGKSKDPRAKHYRTTYSPPALPPIWTMKEFLTFGSASRIFQCLSTSLTTDVAALFGVTSYSLFINWVGCLVDLRNICAHHDRLFNRSFQKQPSKFRIQSAYLPTARPNKLKAILECLDYMLDSRGFPMNVTAKVESIIRNYPEVQLAEAGY